MAVHRTHIRVIGEILDTTQDDAQAGGTNVTHLIRAANISHTRILPILKLLVSQGLLEQVDSRGASRYRLSTSGREFLQAYREFSRFAEDFGLSI
ncbi:hypothetical protein CENSYa_1459 [Cenarchaeum symbiosum A]|uniref:ArnR1-like winged helix-turn-helix domain-containing protein n=1 Tax=Cenarchaeum symbiosum (strain A) TaxID=414004 RepID=A0RXL4_CENSY|nr:hypothetical protein CENSYa_1459 [Cenarchaeum symbiosum A]